MNVFVYVDGLPGWKKRGYPVESSEKYADIPVQSITGPKLNQMLSSGPIPYVLDIRDEDDRNHTGQIMGSNCICLDDLSLRFKEIPRDRQVVIVDLHGKQSKIAARYLASKGVRDLYVLKDGFVKDWVRHGYPVQK